MIHQDYVCTIYRQDSSGAPAERLGLLFIPTGQVGSVAVRARTPHEAAARAYIRTAGAARASVLRNLCAPAFIIRHETDWRTFSGSLLPSPSRRGILFVHDNMVETFYIRVEALAGAGPRAARRRLIRAAYEPSPN